MELREFVRVLRQRWLTVVFAVLAGILCAAVLTLLRTPQYEARTQLFVSLQGSGSVADLQQGSDFIKQRVESYVDIVKTESVLTPVVQQLGLKETTGSLADQITADAPLNTVLINITVSDPSPDRAALLANTVGQSFINTVTGLEQPADAATVPVQVRTIQAAQVPGAPSSPNTRLNLGLGLFAGLALGLVLAAVRHTLDTTIRTGDDLDQFGVPVLASLPVLSADKPLVVLDDPHGARAEGFRQLRTNVQFMTAASGAKSVLLTSALDGEGKSTTATNLALAMAAAGVRVCLVDADLRRPTVGSYLSLSNEVGLTSLLVGQVEIDDAVHRWETIGPLDVITSGPVPPNPSELLSSPQMEKVLRELERRYDIVFLDGAPLLHLTDSVVLAELVGGVLVVVACGRATKPALKQAVASLRTVNAHLLGSVVTRDPSIRLGAYPPHDDRRGQGKL